MQENRANKVILDCPVKFYNMLTSGEHVVSSWDFLDEDGNSVMLTFKKNESFVEENPTTNVVLAAYVLCITFMFFT